MLVARRTVLHAAQREAKLEWHVEARQIECAAIRARNVVKRVLGEAYKLDDLIRVETERSLPAPARNGSDPQSIIVKTTASKAALYIRSNGQFMNTFTLLRPYPAISLYYSSPPPCIRCTSCHVTPYGCSAPLRLRMHRVGRQRFGQGAGHGPVSCEARDAARLSGGRFSVWACAWVGTVPVCGRPSRDSRCVHSHGRPCPRLPIGPAC